MESASSPPSINKCPWSSTVVQNVKLSDVIEEQLAATVIKEKENTEESLLTDEEMAFLFAKQEEKNLEDSDLAIAKALQDEFHTEYNKALGNIEKQMNKNTKVCISLDNYKQVVSSDFQEILPDSLEDPEYWDEFEKEEKQLPTLGKNGTSGKGKAIRTKHDPKICGRLNGKKLMDIGTTLETGDGSFMPSFSLTNRSFNILVEHEKDMNKRDHHSKEKEKSAPNDPLDSNSRAMVEKLKFHGVLSEFCSFPLTSGKEAKVYLGAHKDLPCAVKIYKTLSKDFKDRAGYQDDEYRYPAQVFSQSHILTIDEWVLKEVDNLKKLEKASIPAPKYLGHKHHVLVMEFIGTDSIPALKLKDARLSPEDLNNACGQTMAIMERLYQNCGLVHADLSQYNLLWHNGHVWVIDLSLAVVKDHPKALWYLLRDCINVMKFFDSKRAKNSRSPKQLLEDITKLKFSGENEELESQIFNYGLSEAERFKRRRRSKV